MVNENIFTLSNRSKMPIWDKLKKCRFFTSHTKYLTNMLHTEMPGNEEKIFKCNIYRQFWRRGLKETDGSWNVVLYQWYLSCSTVPWSRKISCDEETDTSMSQTETPATCFSNGLSNLAFLKCVSCDNFPNITWTPPGSNILNVLEGSD